MGSQRLLPSSFSDCLSIMHLVIVLLLALSPAAVVDAWRPWPKSFNSTGNSSSDLLFGSSKKFEGSSEFVHLKYHMGPVLTSNITIHTIWYGAWLSNQKRIIKSFLGSISDREAPSPSVFQWWKTVQLYTDRMGSNISGNVFLGIEKNDRYSHGKTLTRLSVQSIIKDSITATSTTRPPLHVYTGNSLCLVLTSPDVYMQDFCGGQVCGFHSFTSPSITGYTLPYAWIGNSAKLCPGVCAYPFAVPSYMPNFKPLKSPNGDVGVDGMITIIAHEIAEIATNPLGNAWYAGQDPSFPTEIADLCEGIYGTGGGGSYTGQLSVDRAGATYNVNGFRRRFLVQWVWNPVLSYCFGPNALDK